MKHGHRREAHEILKRMDLADREWLFAHMLRMPSIYADARGRITAEMLSQPDEQHLQVLWAAMTNASGPQKLLNFKYAVVRSNTLQILEKIDPDVADVVKPILLDSPRDNRTSDRCGLLWEAFHELKVGGDDGHLVNETGLELLRRFLNERLVSDEVIRQIDIRTHGDTSQYVPPTLVDLLERAGRQQRIIQSIGSDRFSDLLADSGAEEGERFPINIPWLNRPLAGHMMSPHAYVLMGPFSGGKTMVGLNIAIEAARLFAGRALEGMPSRHVYYFHYEVPEVEMKQRCWALAGKVHRDRFVVDGVTSIDDPTLANTGSEGRHKYERDLAKDLDVDLGDLPSERERIRRGMGEIMSHFHVCKMFGDQSVGYNGLDEIQGVLETALDRNNWAPGMVIIDYAGLMIDRELQHKGLDDRDDINSFKSKRLSSLVAQVMEMNARLGCCTWILHQLAGRANKREATAAMHTSEGAGSTSMAENAHAGFALGTKDPESGCSRLHYSKCRGTQYTGHSGIVRMDEFGWFSDAEDYALVSGRFVSKSLAAQVGAAIKPAKSKTKPKTSADDDGGLPPWRVVGSG